MVGDPTSGQPTKGRKALRRIVALGVLLLLLVLAGSAALLAFAGAAVDRLQQRQEQTLAAYILPRLQARISDEVATVAVSDETYRMLRPGGDPGWADDRVGSHLTNNLGHDRVIVLDGADRSFYAWSGHSHADPAALAAFRTDVQPLVDKIRTEERAEAAPAGLGRNAAKLAHSAGGLVRSGGVYYLVGISTVVPGDPATAYEPGAEPLIVSAQTLTGRLAEFSHEMQGRGVTITDSPRPGYNSVPLFDPAGRPIGAAEWLPRKPGMVALRTAAPLVVLGLLLLLGVSAVLGRYVMQIARELEAEELGRLQAMRDLEVARDRAEQANLAKSIFLANMSHEIRTPLNGILGMVQVMERGGLGAPHAERLEIIRDAGQTLLSVLNGILDLSKIEAGRFELDIQDFDLAETVDAACKPFASLAAQKDLEFEIDVDPDAAGVWRGDPMRLRQVLSNLTANAVKFTQEGEVRIEVQPSPKGLAFRVVDTGIGIPADRVSELFQKFVQVDSSMSRRFGGTGLGLAICREFVDIMGGRLAVQTQENEGSTFAFELPLPKVRDAVLQPSEAEAEPHQILPLRILAAEDSRPNQLVLKALLEPLGVDIHIVGDGAEALEAFKDGGFDAVLMDVQMPNMNGVEAARAIRDFEAREKLTPTPILALSANVMPHQVEDYMAAGMDGYVAKPIDAGALIEALAGSAVAEEVRESAAF